jgi:hypothetical protein
MTPMDKGKIRKIKNGVVLELNPEYILLKPAYVPAQDGERKMIASGFSLAHVIEGIAFSILFNKAPQLMKDFATAKVEFLDGKFQVTFSSDVEKV